MFSSETKAKIIDCSQVKLPAVAHTLTCKMILDDPDIKAKIYNLDTIIYGSFPYTVSHEVASNLLLSEEKATKWGHSFAALKFRCEPWFPNQPFFLSINGDLKNYKSEISTQRNNKCLQTDSSFKVAQVIDCPPVDLATLKRPMTSRFGRSSSQFASRGSSSPFNFKFAAARSVPIGNKGTYATSEQAQISAPPGEPAKQSKLSTWQWLIIAILCVAIFVGFTQ